MNERAGTRRGSGPSLAAAAGAVALAAALLAGIGCAGHDSPRWRWDRDREVLPLRPAPAAEPRLRSVVILLPEADGSVGVVEVANAGGKATLSRAREAVAFDDLDNTFIADDAELERDGRPALDAEPAPPAGYTVYFRSGDADPATQSRAGWEAIVAALGARRVPEVTVAAHADRLGSEEFNLGLSRQRAESIRDALVRAGLDGALIEIAWFGETRPAVATADGVAEQRNRRAEIRVR